MNRLLLTTAAILAIGGSTLMSAPAAQARTNYPWCAYLRLNGESTNCGFDTRAQCEATVDGIGGYCQRNLSYRPGQPHVIPNGR